MTFTPTHCRPVEPFTGMVDPPGFPACAPINRPVVGTRGLVVLCHGIADLGYPVTMPNDPTGDDWTNLSNDLLADGWMTVYAQQCGDLSGPPELLGQLATQLADMTGDPSGTANHWWLATLAWWDHVRAWCDYHYGSDFPLVPLGFSNGGWIATQVAANRAETISAAVIHHPALQWSTVLADIYGQTGYDTSSIDLSSTALNGLTVPALLGWGTADNVVDPLHNGDTLTAALYSAALAAGAPVSASVDATGAFKSPTTRNQSVTTTSGSKNITGSFTSADVGQSILGTGIGYGNSIVSQTGTAAVLNGAATASGTHTCTISVGGERHVLTAADTAQILAFMTGTVDPLCPMVW